MKEQQLNPSPTLIEKIQIWIQEKPATTALVVFLLVWYVFEVSVLQVFGDKFARWLFYAELPPRVTGGLIFSPISHDFYDLKHIGTNVVFLLLVGGLAEPYIGKWKVFGLVVPGGYLGMVVTMVSAPIFRFWPIAGASTGIMILWSYAGLQLQEELSRPTGLSLDQTEEIIALVLFIGIPVILVYEVLINGNMSHAVGLFLGLVIWVIEYRRPKIGQILHIKI